MLMLLLEHNGLLGFRTNEMHWREIGLRDHLSEVRNRVSGSCTQQSTVTGQEHLQPCAHLLGAFKPTVYLLTVFCFLTNPLFPTYLVTRDTTPKRKKGRVVLQPLVLKIHNRKRFSGGAGLNTHWEPRA